MISLAYEYEIKKDHLLSIKLPKKVPAGKHQIIVIIDNPKHTSAKNRKLPAPVSIKRWPKNLSLSRKDLYDENER